LTPEYMPNTHLSRLRRALPLVSRMLLGIILIVGALGLFQILRATKAEPTLTADTGLAPLVRTVRVRRVDLARPWTGYGTVQAMDSALVGVQVTGRVVERPANIEAGLAVTQGETLLRIDPLDFERRVVSLTALVTALEAELDQLDVEASSLDEQLTLALEEAEIAEREYTRAKRALEEQGAGSKTEVDQRLSTLRRTQREAATLDQRSRSIPARRAAIEANLASRSADLQVAEEDLSRATVRAPIDGVLQEVMLDTGDFAQAGMTAMQIIDLSRLEVPLALPASAIADLSIGDNVEVYLESGSARRWTGTIQRIAPQADSGTRSIRVFVEFIQELEIEPDGTVRVERGPLLRPGMFVIGRVLPSRTTPYLMVPRRAVVQRGVLVAERSSPTLARRVDVDTIFAFEGTFEGAPADETQWLAVASGLDEGQLVLVSNLDELEDGSPIRVEGLNADAGRDRP